MTDDERLARIVARMEAIDDRERGLDEEERAFGRNADKAVREAAGAASSLAEARERSYFARETQASCGALAEARDAERERLGEERTGLLAELVEVLPRGVWIRHPLRPKEALMLYESTPEDLVHEEGVPPYEEVHGASWRMARQAPPGAPPYVIPVAEQRLREGLADKGLRVGKWGAGLGWVWMNDYVFVPTAPDDPAELLLQAVLYGAYSIAAVGMLLSLLRLAWFLCVYYLRPARTLGLVALDISSCAKAKHGLLQRGFADGTEKDPSPSGAVPGDERPRSQGDPGGPAEKES